MYILYVSYMIEMYIFIMSSLHVNYKIIKLKLHIINYII